MIFIGLLIYGICSGNLVVGTIGSCGLAYAVWDRQNWLARQNGTLGETGWVKFPRKDSK